jgi:hypothetical protein
MASYLGKFSVAWQDNGGPCADVPALLRCAKMRHHNTRGHFVAARARQTETSDRFRRSSLLWGGSGFISGVTYSLWQGRPRRGTLD